MKNICIKYLSPGSLKAPVTRGLLCSVILLLSAFGVNAQTWQVVGSVDFSGIGDAWNTCIAIDTGGVPYVVYEDATRADKTTVMKFNGTSWVPVDTAGVTPGGAGAPAIAMDKYGTPYVVYSDGTNNDGTTVMKHVGSSWDVVGAPGFSGNLINFPSIAVDTFGTIYTAYIDGQYSNSVTVMKNSGSGWVGVGTPGFSNPYSAYTSLALDPSGTPYVVYQDGYEGPATVVKFDGTNWVTVGSAGFTPTRTYSTFIKIDKYGTPYVCYSFGNGSYTYGDSAGVMKFNGSSWVSLNPTKFSVTPGNPNISIALDTFGAPYVVYADFFQSWAATVKAYNGTSWVAEGNTAFSAAGVQYPNITVTKNGTIYVSYMDQANNYGATVMELQGLSAMLGVSNMCVGSSYTFSDASAGGTWSSSNTSVATIGSSTGLVTAIATGTTMITYTLGGSSVTSLLNVNSAPAAISGPSAVCTGSTIMLTDATPGGSWSTGSATIFIEGSGSVLGYVSGTATVTYTMPSGCYVTTVITINAQPSGISGVSEICAGATTYYSDFPSGGAWSSGTTGVATVGTDGTVTGVSAGTANISYTMPGGCYTSSVITVDPSPSAISGPSAVCTGSTITLTDATPGGSWSTGSATIFLEGSGSVLGYVSGTATVTYTAASGCYVTKVITINAQPSAISGVPEICAGATTYYSDFPSGGAWSSGATGVATVGTDGTVTGVSAGTANISYTMPGGCYTSSVITVDPSPSAISGPSAVCTGSTIILTDATPGGSWSTGSATIFLEGSGSVLGYVSGTATVTYTMPSGCYVTAVITISAQPSGISGVPEICAGATTYYSDYPLGGAWSSGATGVATVGTDGTVTGVSAGTANISYTMPGGCYASSVITIDALPSAISGPSAVCVGSTIILTDGTPGGSWSTGSATIFLEGSGSVLGYVSGTAIVTYTMPSGCYVTKVITINQQPSAISGVPEICTGATTYYSDFPSGGAWSSGATGVATVGTDGTVTGVSAGTANITYTMPGGCYASSVITIDALPSAISGPSAVCVGSTIILTDATPGGSWSTGSATIFLEGSGSVLGYVSGTATVTYTMPSGCYVTKIITINQLPSTISGSSEICTGSTTSYSDSPSGGAWSSGATGVATVGTNGRVTGVSAGTANITYTMPGGCYTSSVITVDPLPSAIGGPYMVCVGSIITLTDATPGGTWSTSSATIMLVGSDSVLGYVSGTARVTYTIPSGCYVTTTITVNTTSAGIINGASIVNTGANITLTDATAGGIWSASNANATVTGGTVTGVTAGTVTISYAVTGSCGTVYATKVITVNNASLPSINGVASICPGTTTSLSDVMTGGTWSSSNVAVATIGGTTGIVSGVAAGTTNITYTQGGAHATITLTVNIAPLPVQGATSECAGTTITVSDNTSGGTWSSSGDVGVVTAGTNSGTVTAGATAGTGTITYSLSDGCYMTYPNTVIANPSAIFGATTVCVGSATVLSDSTMTAVSWTSSNTLVATVAITGHVTGVAGGTVTITYKASSGCIATTIVSVTSAPGAITGNSPVCAGSTITLGDVSGAGTWSSSNAAIAAVGSGSGIVTGVVTGTATITYFPNAGGCKATAVVTVSAAPAISGNANVCAGTTTTLSDASTGGTWSSSNTSIATVGSTTGLVTGVSAGSVSITYTLVSGCTRTITVNVGGTMSPIAGATSLCASATATLSDITGGGTWSSSNNLVASVGTSGLVTASAVNTGTVTISYSGGGCVATVVLMISANPLPVQGAISECAGTTVTLTDNTSGGTWSITGAASITGTGVLTAGAVAGTATVTYTIGSGCFMTYPNTVIKNPSAIFGAFTVCAGAVTILSDSSATGVSWVSSNTLAATVAPTGHVTGVASGTAIITYKALPGNCIAIATVTVNAAPSMTPITGPTSIAEGTPATLTEATGGGVWSSSNTSKITLSGSTGSPITATAVALSGSSVISYVVTNGFGCSATATLTIMSTSPPHATGVETTAGKINEVLLYPNPTSSTINIKVDVSGIFYLYSLDGKALGTYKISEGITSVNLPSELAPGIYIGRYVDEDGNISLFKVVKE